MSSDLSAEITAIATVVLAAFAIFTTVFALLAFRKQSREVGILEQQMREHQQAQEHEADERHRAQASRVWVVLRMLETTSNVAAAGRPTDKDITTPTIEAMVTNASEQQQPIYDAKLHWYCGSEGYGTLNPEPIGPVPGYERTTVRRQFPVGTDLTACGAFLTFRDAAGFAWMRAPDGALTEHLPKEVDDAAEAAIRTCAVPASARSAASRT